MSEGITVFEITIQGVASLLMHNGQLSDPLNEHAKALAAFTKKKKKTEHDYREIQRLEFIGGLYWDDELGVVLPAELLEACLKDGAKKKRLGRGFSGAVFVDEDAPLDFGFKPKDPQGLWDAGKYADVRGVRNQRGRIQRTRPCFSAGWKSTFRASLIKGADVNPGDIKQAASDAGLTGGVGDFRPRYGRFNVLSFKEV